MSDVTDTIGFIRTIGERTEDICRETIEKEIPVCMVRNHTLSESVVRICTDALKSGKKFTLYADADYMPREGFVSDLYEVMQDMPPEVMAVKGVIKDKFMLDMRGDTGGPILYRTHIFRRWLRILHRVDNGYASESQCIKVLNQEGYRFERTNIFTALHDYEQYYHHIYRSCFLYGKKQKRLKKLIPRWKELAISDKDYEVCLYAFDKGLQYRGNMQADYKIDYGFNKSPFRDWRKEPL